MTNSITNNKPLDAEVVHMPIIEANDGMKKSTETYQQWGTRRAGMTNASPVALQPALNSVVQDIKLKQAQDERAQEDYKAGVQAEIESHENDIAATNDKIANHRNKIASLNASIQDLKKRIEDALKENRTLAKVYFTIGAVINFFLGVYLFVFYSSASYSAFFRPDDDVEMVNAIFYPKAYGDAWNTSVGQFLFVLLMPVIFLGLGFLLHRFTQKQGASKYFKISMLYIVTFVFDALLAFEISEKMYIPTLDAPNYLMSMAFESPNFWVIIFAGFIAYVIWGLVFDFTMDSYAEMTAGLSTKKECNKAIDEIKKQIAVEEQSINSCNAAIASKKCDIASLRSKITNGVAYDTNAIKRELNNFFQGWISYMKQIGASSHDISDARAQLDAVIASI